MSAPDQAAPELLPCPFCGSEARIYEDPLPLYPVWWIECAQRPHPHHSNCHKSAQEAITAWNRRADLAAPSAPAEVEGLVERMTRITRYKHASRNQTILNCELGTICLGDVDDLCTAILALQAENERLKSEVEGYREWGDDIKRLTRDLDVEMHGEANAAKQASLCDLIGAGKELRARAEKAERELTEAREKNGALIERAIWQVRSSVPGHMLVGDTEHICAAIRALDPEATAARAALVKRVREEETRRASIIVSEECLAAREGKLCDAILARLDQPKAESGE